MTPNLVLSPPLQAGAWPEGQGGASLIINILFYAEDYQSPLFVRTSLWDTPDSLSFGSISLFSTGLNNLVLTQTHTLCSGELNHTPPFFEGRWVSFCCYLNSSLGGLPAQTASVEVLSNHSYLHFITFLSTGWFSLQTEYTFYLQDDTWSSTFNSALQIKRRVRKIIQ